MLYYYCKRKEGDSMRDNVRVDYSLYILLIISILLMFINFGGSIVKVGNLEPVEKVGIINAEIEESTTGREQV